MTFTANWFPSSGMFHHYLEARCGNGRCACTTLLLRHPDRPARAIARGIERTDALAPSRAEQAAEKPWEASDNFAQGWKRPATEWRFHDRVRREWRDFALTGGSWRAFYERLFIEPVGGQHIVHDREHMGSLALPIPLVVKCPICGADNLIPLTETT